MDDSSSASTVMARLEKLERENRFLKRLGLMVLLAVGAVVAMAQAPAKRTVVADEFDLTDGAGAKRAVLELVRGEPRLTLFGAMGKTRSTLGTDFVVFTDSNGTERVLLGSSNGISYKVVGGETQITDQGPALMLFGADGKAMADLRGMSQGAGLRLSGNVVSSAPGSGDQVRLESNVDDGPSLWLIDAQGFQTAVGSVSLKTPTTGLSSRTSAASVVLFDKSGKSIWSAP